MIPALVTTLLWSYCVIAARRSVAQLGENLANLARILVAVVLLGLIAHLWGMGLGGGGLKWFLISGLVGFGIGDIGIFYALPRIGSRLTLLMAQCLAAPIAGFSEWWLMGTALSWAVVAALAVILAGICIAIFPKHPPITGWRSFAMGIGFGLVAAIGQGLGAVFSRMAYRDARASGEWWTDEGVVSQILLGATAGYQRLIGGVAVILALYLVSLGVRSLRTPPRAEAAADSVGLKARYVLLTALAGPVIGIICFQWALATTPSGIVQPIVAMTPLVVMPMAWLWEGDRPSRRGVIGSLVSVAGVLLLASVY